MNRFAASFALVLAAAPAAADSCAPDRVDIRGPFGEAQFSVEIADTDAERQEGLMYRMSLAPDAGMLFVYDTARDDIGFWMKNTLIPLDMLFLRPDGTVQYVHAEAQPGDLRPIWGGPGVSAVLEIAGGRAAALGIAPGAQIRAPAFDGPGAVWPCDGQ